MRRSLVPNLVDTAHFNQRRGARAAVRLFEIARVYYPALPGEPLPTSRSTSRWSAAARWATRGSAR